MSEEIPRMLAVIDSELRVHGVEGLRVAAASIMLTIRSGNTKAPTIMIGGTASDLARAYARQAYEQRQLCKNTLCQARCFCASPPTGIGAGLA